MTTGSSRREREIEEEIESAMLSKTEVKNTASGTLDLLTGGDHCKHPLCRQYTFFPFGCAHCTKVFCEKHWKPEQHDCQEVKEARPKIPSCPKCKKALRKPKNLSYFEFLKQHQESGCKKFLRDKKNHCQRKRCKKKAMFGCGACGGKFCVTHRWNDVHNCQPVSACGAEVTQHLLHKTPKRVLVS